MTAAVLVGTPEEQDRARDALVSAASELRSGPGAQEDTDVCPLVGPEARERVGPRASHRFDHHSVISRT